MIPVKGVLWLSSFLLCIGVYGMLSRRNAIGLLLSVELILNAAAVNFIVFSRLFDHVHAQIFALFIIALAACEAAVGLAIVLSLFRCAHTVSTKDLTTLKG